MKRALFLVLLVMLLLTAESPAFASGTFEQGDQGEEVAAIQSRLESLGYATGAADGDFGPKTAEAVKKFQKDRGLEADGVVGQETYRALMGRDIPVSRSSSTALVRRITQTALRYTGVPYVFGGTDPSGFDCSGYVRFVFARNGINLPRTADAQYGVGVPISYQRLKPGDIVFFTTYAAGPSHNGIYLGDGRFVHASSSRGVTVDMLASSYWSARYIGARRIL